MRAQAVGPDIRQQPVAPVANSIEDAIAQPFDLCELGTAEQKVADICGHLSDTDADLCLWL